MSKNTINEMVRGLCYPLSPQASKVIRRYLYRHHDKYPEYRYRMTRDGDVRTRNGVELTTPTDSLEDVVESLVACLPLSRHHIMLEPCYDNVNCLVIQAGLVPWHDDKGMALHNRRLLIAMTHLPLSLEVGVEYAQGKYRVTKSASIASKEGCLKAFVFDGNKPHRVVLDEGACLSDVAHRMPVTYLDLPLKNVRCAR